MDEPYENEDVELVFQSADYAQREAAEKAAKQSHDELMTSFWRDLLRLRQDGLYADDWDMSKLSNEQRAQIPTEAP